MFGIRDQFFRVRSKTTQDDYSDFETEELAREYIAKENVDPELFELCCFTKQPRMVKFEPFEFQGKLLGVKITDPEDPDFVATVGSIANLK